MKRVFTNLLSLTFILICITALFSCDVSTLGKRKLNSNEIYSKVNPSVVFVLIKTESGYSSGSGFFIDEDGTIVTNYHVIEGGVRGDIKLYDSSEASINKVLGYNKKLDIAILSTSASNTTPVKLANSDSVEVGSNVYAIGYPQAFSLGTSSSTFTSGMVSMRRTIDNRNYIQSTVEITHGNSGGPLINQYGEVIGITSAGIELDSIDYMNLSIPSNAINYIDRTVNQSLLIVSKFGQPVKTYLYVNQSLYETVTYGFGDIINVALPQKSGYVFDGWYSNASMTEKYEMGTPIMKDVVFLYGEFTPIEYDISYKLEGGTFVVPQDSIYDASYSGKPLPTPVKNGALFEGWTDSSGNYVDFYPLELQDLILKANWIENAYGLTISNNAITACLDSVTRVKVPDCYRGQQILTIKESAFSGNSVISEIIISNGISSIEARAFKDCVNLETITLPNSVKILNDSTFLGCSKLKSINLPSDITTLGNYLFKDCASLSEITIPNSVTTLGTAVFYNCISLKNIVLPQSITTIGDRTFSNCTLLNNVVFNNNITSIQNYMFSNCISLTTLNIPNTVTNIGSYAFDGCTKLDNIVLPSNITVISICAFRNCSSLSKILLPENCSEIEANAFTDCVSLTEVYLNSTLKEIKKYAFSRCSMLNSIIIPLSVEMVGLNVFDGCSNLSIFCEAPDKPNRWSTKWNQFDCPVTWGYKKQ